ncbi:MAG: hypothetical protein ACR2O6_03600 [Ilumatobacteraceae bacterium]
MSEVLDVPVGTVKSRIARGRSMVAKRLRFDDTDPPGGNRDGHHERPTDLT